MNLGLRVMQIKLASGFIAEKGILSASKWIVIVNEDDQVPTYCKHGTSTDFSSLGVIGKKAIDNAGPGKHSVLLLRESNSQKPQGEKKVNCSGHRILNKN